MNMNLTLEQIILIIKISFFSFLAILVIALTAFLSIWLWNKRTKNNPNKALFLVDFETETIPIAGYATHVKNNQAVVYTYGKNTETITVPNDYGFNYVKHRRKIEITAGGDLVYPKDKLHISQERYHLIVRELTLENIGADIVHAVKSNKFKLTMAMIVIIILIVGVAGFGIYNITSKKTVEKPQTQSQTITPTIPVQ